MPRASSISLGLLVACLLLQPVLAATDPPSPTDGSSPPILLRETQLLPPVATTGVDHAPEVKVRVAIDDRGKVSTVEVLSIKPTTEYDEVFRQHTIAELEQWRYGPAIENGQPVSETMEWIVQYKAPSSNSINAGPSKSLLPRFIAARRDAEARHQQVLSLPAEKRKEILLSYSQVAEKYLLEGRRQEFSSPRFVVVSDSDSPDLSRVVAHNLEAALNIIQQMTEQHVEPQPDDLKMVVYLYSQRTAFEAMRLDLARFAGDFATYYAPGLIAYYLERSSADYLLSFLIHEASHAYSDHHLRRAGFPFPYWFEEGFAEYMGNSQIKKGQLLPGKTLKRKFVLNHRASGAVNTTTVAGWDLQRVKQALRQGEALSLKEVVSAGRDIFYGDRSDLYYGMSWLLIHFLRHGEAEWQDRQFPTMMLYMAEGYPAAAAVETAYGQDLQGLEQRFLEYARKF